MTPHPHTHGRQQDDRHPRTRLEAVPGIGTAAESVREVQAGMLDALAPPAPYDIDAERLGDAARRALVVEGEVPDLTGARVLSVATEANIAVGDVPWGLAPDEVVDPVAQALPGRDALVVQVRDAHRRPEVGRLLQCVQESRRPAVVVEWGWPGPYDGEQPRICTRGVSGPGGRAVTALLREKGWTR